MPVQYRQYLSTSANVVKLSAEDDRLILKNSNLDGDQSDMDDHITSKIVFQKVGDINKIMVFYRNFSASPPLQWAGTLLNVGGSEKDIAEFISASNSYTLEILRYEDNSLFNIDANCAGEENYRADPLVFFYVDDFGEYKSLGQRPEDAESEEIHIAFDSRYAPGGINVGMFFSDYQANSCTEINNPRYNGQSDQAVLEIAIN